MNRFFTGSSPDSELCTVMVVERLAHGGNMVRCCTTAASDELYTGFCKAQCIIREIIRSSYIEKTVAYACWQACIRLCREQVVMCFSLITLLFHTLNHLLQCI